VAAWRSRLLLSLPGGRLLVADARLLDEKGYDFMLWDNAAARVMLPVGDVLYLGDDAGRVRAIDLSQRVLSDDGAPITVRWTTALYDDGDPTVYKLLPRDGGAVMLMPHPQRSVKLTARVDGTDFDIPVRPTPATRPDFAQLDFSGLTFAALDETVLPLTVRLRRYGTIRLTVSHSSAHEDFGLLAISRRYRYTAV